MLNLFSKKKENPFVAGKGYPAVVHEIHNEFLTAGDTILGEAKKLLADLESKDLMKGKRLAKLGFGNTREAAVAVEAETKLAITKELAELVEYYQVNYPNNKFITEGQVATICRKYGLVYGKVSFYKGFVPENKLSIIESFSVKGKDKRGKKKLQICAPVKDMAIPSNYERVGDKIKHIPDPVVLQPVKGGYLIVCAWGDEASDPMVVNEIAN